MIELLRQIAPDVLAFFGVSVVLAVGGLVGMTCCRKRSAATRHAVGMVAVVLILASPFCRRLLPDWGGFSVSEMTAPTAGTVVELPVPITEAPDDGTGRLNVAVLPSDEMANESHIRSEIEDTAQGRARHKTEWTETSGSIIGHSENTPKVVDLYDEPAEPWQQHDHPLANAQPEMAAKLTSGTSLVALWLMGCTVGVLLIGLSLLRMFRSVRRGEDEQGDLDLARAVSHFARELGVDPINVQISGDAAMPSVWGFGVPWLVLPKTAHEWPVERLQMVLAHELAHVKRGDWFWLLLLRLAQAACWINPLIWLLGRRLLIECERACDDRVITKGVRSTEYSRALLEVVTAAHSPVSATAIPMAHFNDLDERIRSVLDLTHSRSGASRMALVVTVLVLLAIVVPMTTVRALTRDELRPFRPIRNFADGSYVELVAIGSEPIGPKDKPTWWTGDGAIINDAFLSDQHDEFAMRPKSERESSSLVMFALRPVITSNNSEASRQMHFHAKPALRAGLDQSDSRLQYCWAKFQPGQKRLTLKVALPDREQATVEDGDASTKYEWVEFSDVPLRPDRTAPLVANPLETFRPIEVRPNAETAVHDVDGRFVRDEPERFLMGYHTYRPTPHRHCQLRCVMPESLTEMTPVTTWLRDSRTGRRIGYFWGNVFDVDGHQEFVADMYVPEQSDADYVPRSIDEADLELRYLSGPMKSGRLTFEGPFECGSEYASTTGTGTLRIEKSSGSATRFYVDSKTPFDERHVCFYDRDGQRILNDFGGRSDRFGVSLSETVWDRGVVIEQIAAITVAEPLRVTRIRRIKVADCTPRQIDPDTIRQAKAFGMSVSGKLDSDFVDRVRGHRFASPDEIVRAMPVLREPYQITVATDTLLYYGRGPAKLTQEQQDQVLSVCKIWQRAYSPLVQNHAMKLGLWLRPDDHIDAAIDAIALEPRVSVGNLAGMLAKQRKRISTEQLERIEALISTTRQLGARYSLIECMLQMERADCRQMMDRIAAADEPWIWWPAVRKIAPLRLNSRTDWTKQFMERQLLSIRSFSDESKPEREALWKQHAADLLTLKLFRKDKRVWQDVVQNLDRFVDPEMAPPIVVDFLRELLNDWGGNHVRWSPLSDWEGVASCVRYLNSRYETQIGGEEYSGYLNGKHNWMECDWKTVAREAIEWREKLVDTRGGRSS